MEEEMNAALDNAPQWLMALIYAEFSTTKGKNDEDRKYFCVDCAGPTFTESEKEAKHENHTVLRPLKCSGVFMYLRQDILSLSKRGLDISGVCAFSINNNYLCLPKSRKPQGEKPSEKKGIAGYCVTCGWKLTQEDSSFCSILCKLTKNSNIVKNQSFGGAVSNLVENREREKIKKSPTKKQKVTTKKVEREEEKVEVVVANVKGKELRGLKRLKYLDEQKGGSSDDENEGSSKSVTMGRETEEKLRVNPSLRKRSRKNPPSRAPKSDSDIYVIGTLRFYEH